MIRTCLILIAVSMLLAACGEQVKTADTNNIRLNLESGNTPPPTGPIVIRAFKPYLDECWIGKAVSYGPHRKGQAPGGVSPSDAELEEDLRIIARNWHLIRVYNADNLSERILSIIREENLPIRVMLGIWLDNETESPEVRRSNITNTLWAIDLSNRYDDIVIAVSVGNETQVAWSAHKLDPADLIRYIRTARNNIIQPVSTADDYNFWNKEASLEIAREIDFITMHMHPLWNGKALNETADWMTQTLTGVENLHDRPVIVGEVGWATDYNRDRTGPGEQGTLVKGEVGVDAQGEFLMLLNDWIDAHQTPTFLFEAFDEPWKGGDINDIERNWGVFYEDRSPKASFEFIDNGKQNKKEWRR